MTYSKLTQHVRVQFFNNLPADKEKKIVSVINRCKEPQADVKSCGWDFILCASMYYWQNMTVTVCQTIIETQRAFHKLLLIHWTWQHHREPSPQASDSIVTCLHSAEVLEPQALIFEHLNSKFKRIFSAGHQLAGHHCTDRRERRSHKSPLLTASNKRCNINVACVNSNVFHSDNTWVFSCWVGIVVLWLQKTTVAVKLQSSVSGRPQQ